MTRHLIVKCLLGTATLFAVADSVFGDIAYPGYFDVRRLDDYHYFLYTNGHYVSRGWILLIVAAIGVLCFEFLSRFLARKHKRTIGMQMLLGLAHGALLVGTLVYLSYLLVEPKPFFINAPWYRAEYDRQCIECYESNGIKNRRPSGAISRPIKPRTNASTEVQAAYKRYMECHDSTAIALEWQQELPNEGHDEHQPREANRRYRRGGTSH